MGEPNAGLSPAEKVFSTAELLEMILKKVVTPDVDFKQILSHDYRLLGLNWRDTIFKLMRNKSPYKIFIRSDPTRLAALMNQVSPGCGIPLKAVVASEELSPNQLDALANYGSDVVEMRFWNVRQLNVEATLDVPHVRKLEVGIMDGSVFYSEESSMAGLLDSIVNSSIRLESFSLWLYLQENVVTTRNCLPNKLTSLYLSCRSGLQLEQILDSNDLPNLTSLEISFIYTTGTSIKSEIISRAVNRTPKKLKRLVVKHREIQKVTLSLGRFISLEELDIETQLGTEEDVPFSDVVPRLRKLSLGDGVVKNIPQHLEFLTRNGSNFTNLESMNVFMKRTSRDSYLCRNTLNSFRRFPAVNLTHFHLGALADDMEKMLPIVYSQMTSLRQLHLTTYGENLSLCFLIIESNTSAITNLRNLEELQVGVKLRDPENTMARICEFEFVAAFNQMRNLRKLHFINIKVENELQEQWKSLGREIQFSTLLGLR